MDIERAILQSGRLWDSGFYCAESVLQAVAEAQGVECRLIPRIATGLCSGLARSGGLCGAISGAVLSIGLILGRDRADASEEACYLAVQRVMHEFRDRFGATDCETLAGCHLGTAEGQARFRETNQRTRCRAYVTEATRFVLQTLQDLGAGTES